MFIFFALTRIAGIDLLMELIQKCGHLICVSARRANANTLCSTRSCGGMSEHNGSAASAEEKARENQRKMQCDGLRCCAAADCEPVVVPKASVCLRSSEHCCAAEGIHECDVARSLSLSTEHIFPTSV